MPLPSNSSALAVSLLIIPGEAAPMQLLPESWLSQWRRGHLGMGRMEKGFVSLQCCSGESTDPALGFQGLQVSQRGKVIHWWDALPLWTEWVPSTSRMRQQRGRGSQWLGNLTFKIIHKCLLFSLSSTDVTQRLLSTSVPGHCPLWWLPSAPGSLFTAHP